jgi:hypothetical protein
MAIKELPTKPDREAQVEPRRVKGPTKGDRPPAPRVAKGAKTKPPVSEASVKRPWSGGGDEPPNRSDQKPPRGGGRPKEQYVRLRIRVDDGDFSIVDAHVVDGPLAQTTTFEGAYAYGVIDGARMLHAGSVPDLGVIRSFANPNGTVDQRRHHTYTQTSYEFDARVPMSELKRGSLSRTTVALYRVKERPPLRVAHTQSLSAESLAEQRAREMREVRRVVGLPPSIFRGGRSQRPAR